MDIRLPLESDVNRSIAIGMFDPVNILFAFGMLLLSDLQAEHGSFKVWKNMRQSMKPGFNGNIQMLETK